jgi:serine/threonine-protein kinase
MPKAQDDELVMSLVELASSQPPDAREAYLHTACAGDAELFSQVWDYVQWNHRMQDFLLEPLFPSLPQHRFEPGELLADRFRIVREVAQGGMGIVYEAEDERLGRRIALKCAKSGFHKRLPPEVRHASEISHPNVCKIFEIHTASTTGGEIDFLTMEFLDGETLAARLGRGRLPEDQARAIGRQICAGLAEAHRNQVVHGDLKSNNVILTQDAGGDVRAVITDFGLARRPFGPSGDNAGSRMASAVSTASASGSSEAGGTPDYMAPELWKGEKASAASDVYALGVILYELAAGHLPYPREIQWQDRLKHKPPAAGHGWDSILQKCLDPDPAKRFLDAGEVAETLEPSRALRWWLAAAAAVLLAVVSGLFTFQRATAPKETVHLALLPFQSSQDTAYLAGALSRDTAVQLARLKGTSQTKLVFIPERDVARKQVDSVEKARELLSATHAIRGTLEQKSGNDILHVYLTDTRSGVDIKDWTLRYNPAQLRYVPVAVAGIVTNSLRLPHSETKATVNAAARQDYLTGLSYVQDNIRPGDAVQLLERAVAADPDSPLTWAGLAEAQLRQFSLNGEVPWKEKAQESARQAELRDPDLPEVHMISGWLKKNSGNYELAEADFQRVIELQPTNGDAYRRLGLTYQSAGLLSDALIAFQKAIQVRPDDFYNRWALGDFYIERSQYQESLTEFQKMVSLKPNLEDSHGLLGLALFELRRFPEAENELGKAISIRDASQAEQVLATVLWDTERYREAKAHYLRAIAIGPETASLWLDLGLCYSQEGRKRDARDAFRRGLPLAKKELIQDPRNWRERANQAYLEARLGDDSAAESDIAQVLQVYNDDDTLQVAVSTYEALGRRDQSLQLLAKSPSILRQLSSVPELADLRRDPRFTELLASNHVQ